MKISNVVALVRREVWEHHGFFIRTPLLISAAMVILIALGTISIVGNASAIDGFSEFSITADGGPMFDNAGGDSHGAYKMLLVVLYGAFAGALVWALSYLSASLFQDRKDRSILFWRSLPFSEAEGIVAKLLAGALLYPSIVLLGTLLSMTLSVVIVWVGAHALGVEAFVVKFADQFLHVEFSALLLLVFKLALLAIHFLPFYLWVLLVSAFVTHNPLSLAVVTPLALDAAGWMVFQKFYVFEFVRGLFFGLNHNVAALADGRFSQVDVSVWLIAAGLSAVFFFATRWLREYRYEI